MVHGLSSLAMLTAACKPGDLLSIGHSHFNEILLAPSVIEYVQSRTSLAKYARIA